MEREVAELTENPIMPSLISKQISDSNNRRPLLVIVLLEINEHRQGRNLQVIVPSYLFSFSQIILADTCHYQRSSQLTVPSADF